MTKLKRFFKCKNCGIKYKDDFCDTDDISLCLWCGDSKEAQEWRIKD